MNKDWKQIKIDGITRIERVAAQFRIRSAAKFPYLAGVRAKIMERDDGSFYGIMNMGVKEHDIGQEHWAYGSGSSIQETLEQTVQNLFYLIDKYNARNEDDFVWIDDTRLF